VEHLGTNLNLEPRLTDLAVERRPKHASPEALLGFVRQDASAGAPNRRSAASNEVDAVILRRAYQANVHCNAAFFLVAPGIPGHARPLRTHMYGDRPRTDRANGETRR